MITFSNLGQYGRLGNQLYQYAALYAAGKKNNLDVVIPDLSSKSWHGQPCLLGYFNLSARIISSNDVIEHTISEPPVLGYFTDVLNTVRPNTNINGFFQNTYYFNDYYTDLVKEFKLNDNIIIKAKQFLDSVSLNREVVSVHIRRGDATQELESKGFYYLDYFNRARELFNKDCLFILLTGGNRDNNDIEEVNYLKRLYKGEEFVFSEFNNPLIDLALISMSNHNITCPLTSFGWWGAYLNTNENAKKVALRDYHLDGKTREGFFPKDWILI